MKDYLQDIVKHTHALGFIDLVKVTGTSTETKVDAVSEDRTAIIKHSFTTQFQTLLEHLVCRI